MSSRTWLLAMILLAALMLLPPAPGFLLQQLQLAVDDQSFASQPSYLDLVLSPLRFVGSVAVLGWVWAVSAMDSRVNGYVRYGAGFLGSCVLYVLPLWAALLGPELSWKDLWWSLGTASWYEWMQLHAPLAGALGLWTMHLMRRPPEPAPNVVARLARRWGHRLGR